MDEFFQTLAKNQDFNGNILVAEKGKIIYEKSFGYADFQGKKLNRKSAIFPIASISKTILATAILQQVEKGKIRLNDPASEYLPEFPYPEIKVRHLLSHTSGLPPYNAFFKSIVEANPGKILHNSDFLGGLNANKKPLIYKPGTNGNYDNVNFIVLALILEKVSGEKFDEYIVKNILKSAGMKQTFVFQNIFDSSKNNLKNLVIPHIYPQIYADEPVRADSVKYISDYWKTYQFNGFTDYVSTTHDLLKYDEALYHGKLLGEKILNEAFSPVKLDDGKANPGNFGLGWQVASDESLGKSVLHEGSSTGLNSVIYRNIDKHQTVIAFDIAHSTASFMARNALKILNGQTVSLPKKKLVRVYGKTLVTKGKDAAAETLKKWSKDTENYELDKEDLLALGYELLGDLNIYHLSVTPNKELAIEVFKQNVKFFPDYWNSYDSLADALARAGETETAIKMYEKSIELNPNNEGGKKALQRLLGTKK